MQRIIYKKCLRKIEERELKPCDLKIQLFDGHRLSGKSANESWQNRYIIVIMAKRRKDLGCPDGIMMVVFAPLDGKIRSLLQRAAEGTFFNSLLINYYNIMSIHINFPTLNKFLQLELNAPCYIIRHRSITNIAKKVNFYSQFNELFIVVVQKSSRLFFILDFVLLLVVSVTA